MIVYIPTPITSAEQAESLPDGVHLVRELDDGSWLSGYTLQQRTNGAYVYARHGGTAKSVQNALFHPTHRWRGALIALLPVEAHTQDPAPIPGWGEHVRRHRYVTEWLYGPSPDRRGDCA